jgi:hypothetical protein
MTTPLDKTLKRAITINEQAYVAAISPEGIKLTLKGRRNGVEMSWTTLLANAAPSEKLSREPDTAA